MISICKITLKILFLKLPPHLLGTNELMLILHMLCGSANAKWPLREFLPCLHACQAQVACNTRAVLIKVQGYCIMLPRSDLISQRCAINMWVWVGFMEDFLCTWNWCCQWTRIKPVMPSLVWLWTSSGPRLNIKTVLFMYGDFHVKDKTAVRTSYL